MTNSFFNFTESPDFASALGETYKSVNESYDRREELERENDKTREKNAKMPLELLEKVMKFAPTAKKMVDGINENRRQNLLDKEYDGISQDVIAKDDAAIETIFDFGKAENFIKNEALKNGDNVTYETLDFSGAHSLRRRLLLLERIKQRAVNDFPAWVARNYPQGLDSVKDIREASAKYRKLILTNVDGVNFNLRIAKRQLDTTFDGIATSFYESQNQKLSSKNLLKEQSRMIEEVNNALNSEDPLNHFIETADYNVGFFDGNIAKAERAFINIGLMGMKKGVVNIDKFESVLFGEITAKGDKTRILIDKLGGGEENRLWAEGVLNEIEKAKKGVFENKQQARDNYALGFIEKIQEQENKTGTRMTKLELANHIVEKWDITQGGSNIPEELKNRLAKEEGDDILIKAELDYKLNKGIPITEKEVLKLSNPFLEAQYLPKVKTGNPLRPSKDFQNLAKSQIKGYATVWAKQGGVAPGKESPQWNNIVENAEREYPIFFEKYMATTDSATEAHILALKDIETKTNAGYYDKLVVNRDKNKQRNLELIKAEEHIKTIDPNIINTGIIFGSEEVIKEAAELPTGQTHLFYDQLAAKIPGVTGAEIQYKQLEIHSKLNGTEKPVKSDILLEYEKLSPSVRFYLSHHPSPAKVARAKIEAFKDDAQIDFDEIDFLLPKAKEVINERIAKEGRGALLREIDTDEFLELDKETQEILMPTPTIGQYTPPEPVEGNWQKIPNAVGYYVYKNGEWQRSAQRGNNKLQYKDMIDGYRDIDGYFKPTFKADPSNPNLGAWKKIPNAIGYFVWDGKEWVRSGQKGKGEEFEGEIEQYKDIDLDETTKKVN